MTPELMFFFALAGRFLVPIGVTAALMALPRPRWLLFRCLLAMLVAWITTVVYTAMVYNPAGIALGHALGQDFPEGRYDNNTVAVSLLTGWFIPAVTAAVYVVFRRVIHR